MSYKFADLVDIEELKTTWELFAQLTNFTVAITTQPEQEILFILGYRDLCKLYHRKHNRTNTFCVASNTKLTKDLTEPGKIAISYCANGLIDGATPIFVEGEHIANLFSGQVFFTEPDIAFFERQAKKCGFNKNEYIDAVRKIPIVKENDFRLCMTYLASMASSIAKAGMINKRLLEKEKLLEKTNIDLQIQQQAILDNAPNIISLKDKDNKYLIVNESFAKFCKKNPSDLIGKTDFDCFPMELALKYQQDDKEILEKGQQKVFEEYLENLKGDKLCTETFKTPIYNNNNDPTGVLVISNDITRQKKTEKELKESQTRYKGLFSNINSGIIVFKFDKENQAFIIKDFNKNVERISKLQKKELLGKNALHIFPGMKDSPITNSMIKVIETGKSEYIDDFYHESIHFKGWISAQIYLLPDNEICLLVNDVTKLKQAEEDLRLTNFSIESTDYQLFWCKPDGSIARVNDAACKALGYSKEEFCTMHITDFDPDYEKFNWDVLHETGIKKFEAIHISKDGTKNPVEISPHFFKFENKEYSVCFVENIAERKQIEKALKEKEEDLKLTNFSLDAADFQIYWVRPDGSIARVNDAVCKALGYTKEELYKINIEDFNPLYKNNKWKTIWKSIKEGGLKKYESTHIRKDGTEYPVEISPNYIKFNNEEYSVSFIVDVTERKEFEKQLNQRQTDLENIVHEKTKELQQSLKELEQANLFLQDANNHKNRFLSAMSHELRTPLNAILGFSSTLKMSYYGDLNEKQEEYIDLINDSGRHLLSLIDEILDITKIDSGIVELKFGSIEVKPFIEGIINKMNISFYEKAIKIESNHDENIDIIIADHGKLKQIIKNLLSNALKFTEKGGKIIVSTQKLDDKIKISVKDNGIGIQESEQEKIFQEFYKTAEVRTQAVGGTGIGLNLTKKLIEMHNGQIAVESTPGVGSEFWFIIPIEQQLFSH